MPIRLLDTETHSRLRATVAMVSLDQAVAELVENAIDAGADKVRMGIHLDDGYIQVCDNGKGIDPADAPLLGTRYALPRPHLSILCTNLASNLRKLQLPAQFRQLTRFQTVTGVKSKTITEAHTSTPLWAVRLIASCSAHPTRYHQYVYINQYYAPLRPACRGAIKFNQVLDLAQCQRLMSQLARAKAQDRLKSAFESIFARYDRAFDDECDEVDLSTGNLLVDRGFFRNWDAHQFGDCSDDAHSDSDSADALATSPGHWPPLVAAHSSYSTTTPTRSIITPTPNKRPWLTPTCPPDELVQGLHTLLSTTPTKPFVANPSVLASDPPFLQQLPRTPKARQRRTVPSTIAAIRYRADEVAEDELLDSDLSCALTNIIAATRSRLKLGSAQWLFDFPAAGQGRAQTWIKRHQAYLSIGRKLYRQTTTYCTSNWLQ
ncbi:hypothetical protein H4R35_001618 [Dimargaris xerosporica]|nr:hypothetical protein H4R35_001618 [Dimargaris xerosporica]